MRQRDSEPVAATLPRIEIPPARRPSRDEIERRRALFARVIHLREKIGPIGGAADELVRQARDEDESIG